ncbi:Spy/CpxP family protein refolding chaperone [Limnohabitans sp. 2KL-1]|jgi:hypothetical protein|uniref:Spy/CpxP family protein refolding chaperone n=1 Tax=Limnohabitans sp. 2KL-1 TaxID=1100699 RepID=UPI001E4DD3CC|nr:Spy/CpxP family protein refolding chaperone [Limnohabitans sp. 2KL-1]
MKSILTRFVTVALITSLSGLALAQTAPESKTDASRMERMDKMHARMNERHGKHLSELKAKLKLEATQEAAWTTFEQSMQKPGKSMARPDRASLQKLTTPERIDQMQAHKAQRDAEMQKHADATKTFYGTLNAEQKKLFDSETARAMHNQMGHEGKHQGHHGHH